MSLDIEECGTELGRLLAEGAEAKLSEGELKALRQEILEQETLLKGYQAENEAAVAKLRSVQTEARERENAAIQENGKLRAWMESEMARLNQAKVGSGPVGMQKRTCDSDRRGHL